MSDFFERAWRGFWCLWAAFFYSLALGLHNISRFCIALAKLEKEDRG